MGLWRLALDCARLVPQELKEGVGCTNMSASLDRSMVAVRRFINA
jgi:hypothetical protein